ncbi:MAG: M50 family metallopeptidase [Agromyces sp.]
MESVVNYIIGVLIIVFGLALSIGLHEVGHLLPAKLFGIKVTQYMIGFGPKLWSTRRGETEYGVKLLPLGGYIAMVGMYPPGPDASDTTQRSGFFRRMIQDARESAAEGLEANDAGRTFYSKPVWQRMVVMFGGPVMNLLLAIVFFAILLMGFGVAQHSTTVASVSECVIPAGSQQTECQSTDPLSPAAAAGIQAGDRIVNVNGADIRSWTDFSAVVADSPGIPLSVTVERDGDAVTLQLTPQLTQRYELDATGQVLRVDGEPVLRNVGFAGVAPAPELVPQGPDAVVSAIGSAASQMVGMIATLPEKLAGITVSTINGTERDPNGPISVVGIGAVAGEVFSLPGATLEGRVATMVGMLASLNMALFIFNLIPLLPLDGGHIAAAAWEAIRRQFAWWFKRPDPGPVDVAKLVPLTFVVFAVLLSMSTLLIWADIVNPISLFH